MSEEIREMDKAYAEKKAAELVERICKNCINNESDSSLCTQCRSGYSMDSIHFLFMPTRTAIDPKLEKLRNQIAIKQDLGSNVDEKVEIASKESNKNITNSTNCYNSEMLSLLEECLSEAISTCYDDCGVMPTSICLQCDTGKLKEKIKATIKKAKGE